MQIRNKIVECYTSRISPHFSLNTQDGALRMIAKTAEAIESRTEDNEVYTDLFKVIQEGIPQLLNFYQEIQI